MFLCITPWSHHWLSLAGVATLSHAMLVSYVDITGAAVQMRSERCGMQQLMPIALPKI
ncbi:hypothetical protein BD310DRAFT_926954 [Dichomitus squalens]|uniref:Uncharacterized protein n=1 Tax=Dichomitus squalens TaxID=114155 RepID=A0A4Q9PVC7_9APHY|nr:hypothetical protein BD310DRAFT_926954 [Dichomitus squalens]